MFCDQVANFTPDTSNWTVNFQFDNPNGPSAGAVTTAPEPLSVISGISGLALFFARRRRR